MSDSQTVSVGIVTYNSRDHIDGCLQSLLQQTYPHLDIIVIDNQSADSTVDWIAEHWPQCRLIRNETNVGFANAHNQAIALTASDYYMPLNPDVVLSPTYVAALVEAIQAAPDIGWVCGKMLFVNADGSPTGDIYSTGHAVFADGFAINIGFREPDHHQFEQPREVFGANAAAPLYRRQMLEQLSRQANDFYDQTIFLYGEDVELDWRARLLGWRCLYTPQAVGYHVHGASAGASKWPIRKDITANRYYTVFKNAFLLDVLAYNLPAFMGHCLFMLITEPRRAIATIASVVSRIRIIINRRRWMSQNRKISRQELHQWFAWSRQQRGQQPSTYLERFRSERLSHLIQRVGDTKR